MQHHNRQKSSTFPRDKEVRKIYTFTIPRESFDELNPDKQAIRQLISKHISMVDRLKKNMSYYEGKHKILDETKRENRLVCNHAKDISDTASSYFIGNPVTYKSEGDIKPLTDALELAGADETDGDNGLEASIYGLAYEYVYVKENENNLQTKNLSAENTFMVKDDSIEENELFAVYYYIRKDDSGKLPDHYIATVVTTNYKYELDIENSNTIQATTEPAVPHYLGEIPIIEYLNNKLAIGDFELQIPLIDAYNALMSDRVTDKEQFIDAILAIYGTLLTDEDEPNTEDEDESIRKAKARLKKYKVLEMPDTAKAEYLTRTFDENGVEILKKAIEQDIHKFSHIPCMSDESFGGNVSGVAMEFKLLGMMNTERTFSMNGTTTNTVAVLKKIAEITGVPIVTTGLTAISMKVPKGYSCREVLSYVAQLYGAFAVCNRIGQIELHTYVDSAYKIGAGRYWGNFEHNS